MSETTIEFTDRYGGRAPSWLRGCFGDCEAMGMVPVAFYDDLPPARDDEARTESETDPRLIALWRTAHAVQEHRTAGCDGWHFVPCLDCNGTGRVSWLRTLARIPRWIMKGIRFAPFALRREVSPPEWTFRQRLGNYLNAAFIADLKALLRCGGNGGSVGAGATRAGRMTDLDGLRVPARRGERCAASETADVVE